MELHRGAAGTTVGKDTAATIQVPEVVTIAILAKILQAETPMLDMEAVRVMGQLLAVQVIQQPAVIQEELELVVERQIMPAMEELQPMGQHLPLQQQTITTLLTTQVMARLGLALDRAQLMDRVMVRPGQELVNSQELGEGLEVDLLGHRLEIQELMLTRTIDIKLNIVFIDKGRFI